MISTTTPSIEGKTIVEYKGIVFDEAVAGMLMVTASGTAVIVR